MRKGVAGADASAKHGGMASSDTRVTIEGRTLKLTSLDRVIYPETGTTKADVLAYYAAVAPVMLPHVRNRPATRKRCLNLDASERDFR